MNVAWTGFLLVLALFGCTVQLTSSSPVDSSSLPVDSSSSPVNSSQPRLVHRSVTSTQPTCALVTQELEFEMEGCENAKLQIETCSGTCGSESINVLHFPYSRVNCQCCGVTRFSEPRAKRLIFNCGGRTFTKKIYLRNIKGCGCVTCS